MSIHPSERGVNSIVDTLTGLGAHFTLCSPDNPKRPVDKHWQRQRPSSAKVINHIRQGGAIGLIPASIDSAVLDVDSGDYRRVADAFKPYALYESRTRGHAHCWYESRQPIQLYLWSYEGCSGQVISSNRHIGLPSVNHLSLIYKGMIDNPSSYFPDTSILIPPYPPICDSITSDCHSTTDKRLSDSLSDTGIWDTGDSHSTLIGKVDTLPARVRRLAVEAAGIGERNISLFNDLRHWAYGQKRPDDYRLWEWQVSERALELREHLESLWDFPEREAWDTAKSVARFTWENPQTAASVDSERQRKRAYLRAKRARQKAHNRDAEIVVWRDAHGKSWRQLAALMGMSQEGARKAYNRKVAERGNG